MFIAEKENQLEFSNLPILSQENYLKIKSTKYGWFVNDKFILPFFIDKHLIFKRLIFTYPPIKRIEGLTVTDEKKFLDEVCTMSKQTGCDYISQAQSNVVFETHPDNADFIPWGSYIVDLTKTDDELLASFHSKHRNVIRKAIKDGITISQTNDIEEIYHCISKTLERQNVHAPSLDYYQKLQSLIPNNIAFYIAYKGNEIEGCAVIIYDCNCAYYMYGGSCEHTSSGSLNLLQYEIMKDMRNHGVKTYDLVGARIIIDENSKYAGIQRFKSRFASGLKQGYTFRYIIHPFKYKLFLLSVNLYGKFKGFSYSDAIDQTKKLQAIQNKNV